METQAFSPQTQVSLSQFNSWAVGGAADFYCAPASVEDIQQALQWADENKKLVTILSGGTNVLISDQGVEGLVVHLRKFTGIQSQVVDGRLEITALAGTAKSELLKTFLKYRLEPSIFLAGLPGDVGAGVVMNAGIGEKLIPREFVEITDWVEVLKKVGTEYQVVRLQKNELKWSYRHCDGWQPGIIVRVGLSWSLTTDPTVLERTKQMNQARLKKQPLEWPSCGSVFRNPPGHTSGALIDQCGLRGFRIGGAEVSEKHANFIINRDHATAQDMHDVMRHVQATVEKIKGVRLQAEVVYLGRWNTLRTGPFGC